MSEVVPEALIKDEARGRFRKGDQVDARRGFKAGAHWMLELLGSRLGGAPEMRGLAPTPRLGAATYYGPATADCSPEALARAEEIMKRNRALQALEPPVGWASPGWAAEFQRWWDRLLPEHRDYNPLDAARAFLAGQYAVALRSEPQRVWIVMMNDSPDAVWPTEAEADAYIAKKKEQEIQPRVPTIYWHKRDLTMSQESVRG